MAALKRGLTATEAIKAALQYWRDFALQVRRSDPATKRILEQEWQRPRELTETAITAMFTPYALSGVCGVFGVGSGGLVDVEGETTIAARALDLFLPASPCMWGSPHNPGSHRLLRIRGTADRIKSKNFAGPQRRLLIQLRADGAMSVLPPSPYDEGGQYRLAAYTPQTPVPEIAYPDLVRACEEAAAATLVAEQYPRLGENRTRHVTRLALASIVLRSGRTEDAAITFMTKLGALCGSGGDDWTAVVSDTAQALREGRPATGILTLRELLGEITTVPILALLHVRESEQALVGRCLSAVIPRPVQWIWPRWIALRKVAIMDGDPDLGKTTIMLAIAAAVTRKAIMPDGSQSDLSHPAGVVLMTAEDDLDDTIQPRAKAFGADLTKIYALEGKRGRQGELAITLADIECIRQAIQIVAAKLLIINPLMAYFPSTTDSYKDQHARSVLAPLRKLASEAGVAIVVIRHLNKSGGGNPLYRGGGSIGIIGACRTGMVVAYDPDDETRERRILAPSKNNLTRKPDSLVYRIVDQGGIATIDWQGTSSHTARTLLGSVKDESADEEIIERRHAGEDAVAFLQGELQGGRRLYRELLKEAKQAGITEITLRRAKAILGIRSIRVGFGGGGDWYWAFPDSENDPPPTPEDTSSPSSKDDQAPPKDDQPSSPQGDDHLGSNDCGKGFSEASSVKDDHTSAGGPHDHLRQDGDPLQEAPEAFTLTGDPVSPRSRKKRRPAPAFPNPADPRPVLPDTMDAPPLEIPPGVPIAVDTETIGKKSGDPPWRDGARLVCVGFACRRNGAITRFAVPATDRETIQRWLASPNDKVFHNASYDLVWLRHGGLSVHGVIHDTTWPAAFENGVAAKGLKQLGPYQYAIHYPTETDELAAVLCYCGNDAQNTLALFQPDSTWIRHALYTLYSRLAPRLADVSLGGMPIFPDRLCDTYTRIRDERDARHQELLAFADINWQSQPQVADALSRVLPRALTKTGRQSVAKAVLRHCQHPIAHVLRAFGRLRWRIAMYLENFLGQDRLRGFLTLGGASSGRTSSSQSNLQDVSHDLRTIYGSPDHDLVKLDFSSAELTVAAVITQCRALLDAFACGRDPHIDVASRLFNVPADQVTKALRATGKIANYSMLYGGTEISMIDAVEDAGGVMSADEARRLIARREAAYPEIAAWQAAIRDAFWRGGTIHSVYGRQWKRSKSMTNWRSALAAPISSVASDLLLMGADSVWDRLSALGEICNLVHDEIDVLIPKGAWPDLAPAFREIAMIMATIDPRFPMQVEVAVGPGWGSTIEQFTASPASSQLADRERLRPSP
jgi:DNA polymerase I-like protein with 3'-5' exonuclease and polymerase domains